MIEGKGHPVCIGSDGPVPAALALMIEHDYSQVPVVETIAGADLPRAMITYESIL